MEDRYLAGDDHVVPSMSETRFSGDAPPPLDGSNPLRGRPTIRRLLHRQPLQIADLVMPMLIVESRTDGRTEVPSFELSDVPAAAREMARRGISGVKLFTTGGKDVVGSGAVDPECLMVRAIRAVKSAAPGLCVITEDCLCPYTVSGDCVSVNADGKFDRARSLELLAEAAVLHAQAGADVVGPAAMLEGSVAFARAALIRAGYENVALMPHIIFRSSCYGPYRGVMGSGPSAWSRQGFQPDPTHPEQLLELAATFCDEGADMLLLEPALFTLDVLVELRRRVDCPIGAFSVSAEYGLLRAAASAGWVDGTASLLEFLAALKRAGADFIFTYAAPQVADLLAVGRG